MSKLNIFFDIETFQYNEQAIRTPQYLKNEVYSVYLITDYRKKHYEQLFPSFEKMFCWINENIKVKEINLIAHNGRKFDFHYLKKFFIEQGLKNYNAYLRNSINHKNEYSKKKVTDQDFFFEQHIKAMTMIDLKIFYKNKIYTTVDTYPKFQTSINTLGDLLTHAGVIKESEKKLDYDYQKFNKLNDMSVNKAKLVALNYFNSLTNHEIEYIKNDTIILYQAWQNYDKIFKGFDISKMTLSQNIINAYNVNSLSEYQLLRKYNNNPLKLTDFKYNEHENYYNHLREFYRGGLNMYNEIYLGKTVKNVVHLDLNSSYPNIMYREKIPTFLIKKWQQKKHETQIFDIEKLKDPDHTYLFTISVNEFNAINSKIKSRLIRQIFVKRLTGKQPIVHVDSITLYELLTFAGIDYVNVMSYLKYQNEYFGARDIIEKFYDFKSNAKKLGYSKAEIYVYKVLLNGLYGIPALRPYFNLFKRKDGTQEFYNTINGFENNERNILFSIAVTAYAFRNLIEPLKKTDIKNIDKNILYFDTDSIFFKDTIKDDMLNGLDMDPIRLGAWDVEHKNIDKMYILNHKKYAFEYKGKINVVAGGIVKELFDTTLPFSDFINKQFSDGAVIKSTASILTKMGTMAIYERDTVIEKGYHYPQKMDFDVFIKNSLERETIKQELSELQNISDVNHTQLYYESPTQVLSEYDLYEQTEETSGKMDLEILINADKRLRELIL